MQHARDFHGLGFPQDAIIIHRTGKVLFGKEISEKFIQTKRYINIVLNDEANEVCFYFYTHPKHDRHTLYKAPAGRRFGFIGKNAVKHISGTQQIIPMARIKVGPSAPRSASLVATLTFQAKEEAGA